MFKSLILTSLDTLRLFSTLAVKPIFLSSFIDLVIGSNFISFCPIFFNCSISLSLLSLISLIVFDCSSIISFDLLRFSLRASSNCSNLSFAAGTGASFLVGSTTPSPTA